MKSAFIHDWLVDIGGAEKCVTSMLKIFPSEVYTLLYKDDTAEKLGIDLSKIHSSPIQKMPFATRLYRNYLGWFPGAIESFDLKEYDLIISSSHAVARSVLTHSDQLHISYCYTPIRYAWDLYHEYIRLSGLNKGLKGWYAKKVLEKIRIWDQSTVNRVDHFIAISHYIKKRIKHVYNRDSDVIYPPVDVQEFQVQGNKEDFYLCASRMVPYKKMDLIASAFVRMPDKKLKIIGTGPDMKKVQAAAGKASNIEILGYQPFSVMKENMEKAKGFIFAAEEDFGIIPVEAQACGTPVIAFCKGGSAETVLQNKTGVFFERQDEDSIIEAISAFEKIEDKWDTSLIRKHAESFSRSRFEKEFKAFVDQKYREFEKSR